MSSLIPEKLHTRFLPPAQPTEPLHPRCYTLTHSDRTGDLFLTIGIEHNLKQISGWYTRLMRDEILANWSFDGGESALHIHCHVSGGIVLGTANWRLSILRYHMPQVIQAFRYGDQRLIEENPYLDQAKVLVHFHTRQEENGFIEDYGSFGDYRLKPGYNE